MSDHWVTNCAVHSGPDDIICYEALWKPVSRVKARLRAERRDWRRRSTEKERARWGRDRWCL